MTWWTENNTLANWIKLITLIVFVAGAFVAMDFKLGAVENTQNKHIQNYEQFRYQTVPGTYMRKDVAEQVIIRLERIENKIDNMNQ